MHFSIEGIRAYEWCPAGFFPCGCLHVDDPQPAVVWASYAGSPASGAAGQDAPAPAQPQLC